MISSRWDSFINDLADEILHLLNEVSGTQLKVGIYPYISITRKGIQLIFQGDTVLSKYEKIIDKILEKKQVGKNFSFEYVDKKIKDIMVDIEVEKRRGEREDLKEYTKKKLEEFFNDSFKSIRLWTITVKIENLIFKDLRRLKVGDVIFRKLTSNRLKFYREMFRNIIMENPKYSKDSKRKMFKTFNKRLAEEFPTNSVIAEVSVEAVKEVAESIAFDKIRGAINIIKFFWNTLPEFNIGINGDIITNNRNFSLLYNEKVGEVITSFHLIGFLPTQVLDRENLSKMKKLGFDFIGEYLITRDTKKENLMERIINSIHWYSLGSSLLSSKIKESKKSPLSVWEKEFKLVKFDLANKFLNLITGLESLLIFDPNENISNNLSERVAFLVFKTFEDRKRIKKKLKEFYNLRSSAVHKGKTGITVDNWKILRWLVRISILKALYLVRRGIIRSEEEFKNYFEELKLS